MSEAELKDKARETVTWSLMLQAHVRLHMILLALGATEAQLAEGREAMRERMRTLTMPSLDPAQSDQWAALLEEEADDFLRTLEGMLARGCPPPTL